MLRLKSKKILVLHDEDAGQVAYDKAIKKGASPETAERDREIAGRVEIVTRLVSRAESAEFMDNQLKLDKIVAAKQAKEELPPELEKQFYLVIAQLIMFHISQESKQKMESILDSGAIDQRNFMDLYLEIRALYQDPVKSAIVEEEEKADEEKKSVTASST